MDANYPSCRRVPPHYQGIYAQLTIAVNLTIITIGSLGDVQPYVALGKGLQEAGYNVSLATHRYYEGMIREEGLSFAELPGDPVETLSSDIGHVLLESGGNTVAFTRYLSRFGRSLMGEFFDSCLSACRQAEAVVTSTMGFFMGGFHVVEKLGIPGCGAFMQPIHPTRAFPSTYAPPWLRGFNLGEESYNLLTHNLIRQLAWQLLRQSVNDWRKVTLDLAPIPFWGPFETVRRRRYPVLYGYSQSLLPRPDDWDPWIHVTGFWFLDRPAAWQPPQSLVDFLESGEPPVCIGFGSMGNRDPKLTTSIVLDALVQSGMRGILLTGWGGLAQSDMPETVFVMEWAPHEWLFPHVSAVVHHGGLGTTAAGLRAGVPTITVPFMADQPFWADRLYRKGLGAKPISRSRLTGTRLAAAITDTVSDEGMRSRVSAFSQQLAKEDGIAEAVRVLDKYLNRCGEMSRQR